MDGQNLTKFCIHIIIDKIYVGKVKSHFSQICNGVMALDWCQKLVFAQYLDNECTEFNQILCICSAQSRNRCDSGIALRKVGILTLPGKVGIPTWSGSIPELSVRKVGIGTKWESTIFPAQCRNRWQSKNCICIFNLLYHYLWYLPINLKSWLLSIYWNIGWDWLVFMTRLTWI